MPQRQEPKTLKEYAMICIARHFDLISYGCKTSSEMTQMLSNDSYLNIQSPLIILPGTLLEEMMDTILNGPINQFLHAKHLHHLVLPQLESLKLISSQANLIYGLSTAQKRCKNLRRLDLSYMTHVNPTLFLNLMPNLTKLVSLNLSHNDIYIQTLRMIGKYCVQLKELDISFCPVPKNGLHCLCYNEDDDIKMCHNLLRLNIIGCPIGVEDVCFFLQIVPTLRDLIYENTFQIFNILASASIYNFTKQSQVFDLRQLNCTDDYINEDCADFAVQLCPLVANVTISDSIISNEILYKMMVLDNLCHIRLTNNDNLTMDFQEGVLPVLTVKGHQLHSLLLSKFVSVDIHAIGECCPHLRNLALSEITYYENIAYPKQTYFTELRVLELWTDLTVLSMTTAIVKQLLMFCPKIYNLLISGINVLDDNLLFEIWRSNDMSKLSRLTMEKCPQVSLVPLQHLFDSKNDLCLIRIWSCLLINNAGNDHLQKRIKEENCDTYLEWFSWQG